MPPCHCHVPRARTPAPLRRVEAGIALSTLCDARLQPAPPRLLPGTGCASTRLGGVPWSHFLPVQVPEGQQLKEGSRKHKRLAAIAAAREAAVQEA